MKEVRAWLCHGKAVAVLCLCVIAALCFVGFAIPLQAQDRPPAAETPAAPPPAAPVTPEPPAPAAKPAEIKPEPPKPVEPAAKPEEPKPAEKPSKKEELSNESCIECHNPSILKLSQEDLADQVEVGDKPAPPKVRPVFVLGELNLAIKKKAFEAGVHAESTCVTCHADVKDIPHAERLKAVDCQECHEDSVETIAASAHGKKAGAKAPGCVGCHDVHYGKGQNEHAKDFQRKLCLDCHNAYKMDTVAGHNSLYEAGLHLKTLECMICHQGAKKGVHYIPSAKTKSAGCESCHTKRSILTKEKKEQPAGFFASVSQTSFINPSAMKAFGYMIGADRIPALDALIILAVLAPFGLVVFHGGPRIFLRRKGPIHLPEEKILLHPLIERLWHWFQALCIVMLVITGAMLHWPEVFHGWFDWAVKIHNWFGVAAVIAFLVWLLYNLVTGRISHYFPKKGEIPTGMIKQAKFYGYGIFKHEAHPYAPSEDNKFNPLQKIAYLQFQLMLLPILLVTGILYLYPESFSGVINAIGGMHVLGTVHFILGGLFAAFLVAHVYLATTGETIGENFKAIIFGYGIKSDHGDHGGHGHA